MRTLNLTLIWLTMACAALFGLSAQAESVEAYPDKLIKLVAPYPPGGATDMFARLVAYNLQKAWGESVVVENKPGASGVIGADSVSRAAPDGHTLVVGAVSLHTILPSLLDNMHKAQERLTPVTTLANLPSYVVVPASSPAKTIDDLIKMIRESPGKYTYGSAGPGTSQHVFPELFKQEAKLDILHVPYKGSGAMVVDLLAGRIDMVIEQGPAVLSHIRSGKLRALAATTKKRTEELPDVPTLDEGALPGFEANTWFAIYAPKGTPAPIIEKLNKQVGVMLKDPEVIAKLRAQGAVPMHESVAQLKELEKVDTAKWLAVIKAGGIKIN
ncbi:MAG TPA: tripartite tricarboxylate transporter substrate binding protein [Advenella sp.]|nr:tripartite tricarboxylate transporter substrate binding protein [Advenella sp.]